MDAAVEEFVLAENEQHDERHVDVVAAALGRVIQDPQRGQHLQGADVRYRRSREGP